MDEMDAAEGMEGEEDNISGDGVEEGDDGEGKQEYVKKEYIARPYKSDTGMLEEV